MARFTYRKIFRAAGIAAALSLAFQTNAAMAAQNETTLIDGLIRDVVYGNKGPALVYVGCAAVAKSAYQSSQSVSNALTALGACGALGCMLTDDYNKCLAVDAQLFLLELRRDSIS